MSELRCPIEVRGKGGDQRPLLIERVWMRMPSSSTIWNAGIVLMVTLAVIRVLLSR